MESYNTQQIFTFDRDIDNRVVAPSSGVTLTVEVYANGDWVEDSRSPMVSPGTVFTKNQILRFTPVGGYFSIDLEGAIKR